MGVHKVCSMNITKPLKTETDQILIQLAQSGNNDAIAEIVKRYQNKVFTTIFYLVKDKYIAEDLFQDTFIKVMNHIRGNKYVEQGKLGSWIVRIAHNLCIDYFRKAKQQAKIVDSNGEDIFSYMLFSEENAEKKMIKQENSNKVQMLIEQLPESQKEVLLLRIYGELSFKEIAQITGVSINTALGRMRYALNNIKKQIEEKKMALR